MSKMEADEKHVGILTFTKAGFNLKPIRVNFQRKMIIEEVLLKDIMSKAPRQIGVHQFIRNYFFSKYGLSLQIHPDKLPLIRVKIYLDESENLNPYELELMFKDYAANKQ